MPKPSTIELLPADIKAALDAWLNDPRITQEEAAARVNQLLELAGEQERVSKSSVNRYAVQTRKMGERMRQSREISRQFIEQFGSEPQGETGMIINSGLMQMVFDLMLKVQDDDIDDPEVRGSTIGQLNTMALMLKRLEEGSTINIKRAAEIRKQALDDLAAKVDRVADANKTMTADDFKQIIRESYGV